LAADLKDQVIRLYDVRTGKEVRVLAGQQEHPSPAVFSPDGKWLAAVCFSKADREMRSKLKVWNVETGAELPQFQGQRVPLGSTLAFSPDSKIVAAEADDGIYLWEIATGKKRIKLEQGRAYSLAFSADGRKIASGHWEGTVCLWEVASGKRICRFDGHLTRVFSIAFSPDGRTLSSGSEDATVLIWDLAGRLKQTNAKQVKLQPRELESQWNDLTDVDAAKAHQSIWALVDAAQESVPFLETRLRKALSKDADREKRIAQMIAALDSDRFAEREKAMTELEALGDLAEPALRQALERQNSLEVHRRVERLLETLAGPITSPETLQVVRAVEALERIGTPDARQVLETLAKAASQGQLVQDAKAALERLAKR
jgi:dipeptidyl aminopeptidase/acylaminoacyl peptidase